MRPTAYVALADLVVHTSQHLRKEHLSKIIFLFSRFIHDETVPLEAQVTPVRLLLNIVENIVQNGENDARLFLQKSLHTLVTKLHTIADQIPKMIQNQKSTHQRKKSPPDINNSDNPLRKQIFTPTPPPYRCAWFSQSAGYEDEKQSDAIQQSHEAVCREMPAPFFDKPEEIDPSVGTIRYPVPDWDSAKNIIRIIFEGMKSLLWCLQRIDEPTKNPPQSKNSKESSKKRTLTEDELELVSDFFKYGLLCTSVYTDADPQTFNEQCDALQFFADVFTVLEPRHFHDVLSSHVDLLYDAILRDQLMLHFAQHFLGADQTSTPTCLVLLDLLMEKLPLLGRGDIDHDLCKQIDLEFEEMADRALEISDTLQAVDEAHSSLCDIAYYTLLANPEKHNSPEASIIFRLFKLTIIYSLRLKNNNEFAFVPYLRKLTIRCIRHLPTSKNPLVYLYLLKISFRAVQMAQMHQELLLDELKTLLPLLFKSLHELQRNASIVLVQELLIETCLKVPRRFRDILTHLPLMREPLLAALNCRPEHLGVGLQALQFWMECFTIDMLLPVLKKNNLLEDICNVLARQMHVVHSQDGARILSILGKLGGKSRTFLYGSCKIDSSEENIPAQMAVSLKWKTSETKESNAFSLPMDKFVNHACNILELSFQSVAKPISSAKDVLLPESDSSKPMEPVELSQKCEVGDSVTAVHRILDDRGKVEVESPSCIEMLRESQQINEYNALMRLHSLCFSNCDESSRKPFSGSHLNAKLADNEEYLKQMKVGYYKQHASYVLSWCLAQFVNESGFSAYCQHMHWNHTPVLSAEELEEVFKDAKHLMALGLAAIDLKQVPDSSDYAQISKIFQDMVHNCAPTETAAKLLKVEFLLNKFPGNKSGGEQPENELIKQLMHGLMMASTDANVTPNTSALLESFLRYITFSILTRVKLNTLSNVNDNGINSTFSSNGQLAPRLVSLEDATEICLHFPDIDVQFVPLATECDPMLFVESIVELLADQRFEVVQRGLMSLKQVLQHSMLLSGLCQPKPGAKAKSHLSCADNQPNPVVDVSYVKSKAHFIFKSILGLLIKHCSSGLWRGKLGCIRAMMMMMQTVDPEWIKFYQIDILKCLFLAAADHHSEVAATLCTTINCCVRLLLRRLYGNCPDPNEDSRFTLTVDRHWKPILYVMFNRAHQMGLQPGHGTHSMAAVAPRAVQYAAESAHTGKPCPPPPPQLTPETNPQSPEDLEVCFMCTPDLNIPLDQFQKAQLDGIVRLVVFHLNAKQHSLRLFGISLLRRIAVIKGQTIAELLAPYKQEIYLRIFQRDLRNLPPVLQAAYIHVMGFCLSLFPPLFDVGDTMLTRLQEIRGIMESTEFPSLPTYCHNETFTMHFIRHSNMRKRKIRPNWPKGRLDTQDEHEYRFEENSSSRKSKLSKLRSQADVFGFNPRFFDDSDLSEEDLAYFNNEEVMQTGIMDTSFGLSHAHQMQLHVMVFMRSILLQVPLEYYNSNPQWCEQRNFIVDMLFKGLLDCRFKILELVATAHKSLRMLLFFNHVFGRLSIKVLPRDQLQLCLRSTLTDLSDVRKMDLNIIYNIHKLLQLMSSQFNNQLASKLGDHLKLWSDSNRVHDLRNWLQQSHEERTKQPRQYNQNMNEFVRNLRDLATASGILNLFPHLPNRVQAFEPFMIAVLSLDRMLPEFPCTGFTNSPYHIPCISFLNKHATQAVRYFLENGRLSHDQQLANLFKKVICHSEAGPLRDAFRSAPHGVSHIIKGTLDPKFSPNRSHDASYLARVQKMRLDLNVQGLQLVHILSKDDPEFLGRHPEIMDHIQRLWLSPTTTDTLLNDQTAQIAKKKPIKHMLKCMMMFCEQRPTAVHILFSTLLFFKFRPVIDKKKLKNFYVRYVQNLSLDNVKLVLIYFSVFMLLLNHANRQNSDKRPGEEHLPVEAHLQKPSESHPPRRRRHHHQHRASLQSHHHPFLVSESSSLQSSHVDAEIKQPVPAVTATIPTPAIPPPVSGRSAVVIATPADPSITADKVNGTKPNNVNTETTDSTVKPENEGVMELNLSEIVVFSLEHIIVPMLAHHFKHNLQPMCDMLRQDPLDFKILPDKLLKGFNCTPSSLRDKLTQLSNETRVSEDGTDPNSPSARTPHDPGPDNPKQFECSILCRMVRIMFIPRLHNRICKLNVCVQQMKTSILLLQFCAKYLRGYRKELIKFAWNHLKSLDVVCKRLAYVNVCRFIDVYETPSEIVLQVYISLLRAHCTHRRTDSAAEPYLFAHHALDILLSALPRRMNGNDFVKTIRYTRKIIFEDDHVLPQIVHVWQVIARHAGMFYHYRAQFVPLIINSLKRLGLTANCALESKTLAVDLAEIILLWEDKRRQVEFDAGDDLKKNLNPAKVVETPKFLVAERKRMRMNRESFVMNNSQKDGIDQMDSQEQDQSTGNNKRRLRTRSQKAAAGTKLDSSPEDPPTKRSRTSDSDPQPKKTSDKTNARSRPVQEEDNFRLSKKMITLVANFLVRMALQTADPNSHEKYDQTPLRIRSLNLAKYMLSMWPQVRLESDMLTKMANGFSRNVGSHSVPQDVNKMPEPIPPQNISEELMGVLLEVLNITLENRASNGEPHPFFVEHLDCVLPYLPFCFDALLPSTQDHLQRFVFNVHFLFHDSNLKRQTLTEVRHASIQKLRRNNFFPELHRLLLKRFELLTQTQDHPIIPPTPMNREALTPDVYPSVMFDRYMSIRQAPSRQTVEQSLNAFDDPAGVFTYGIYDANRMQSARLYSVAKSALNILRLLSYDDERVIDEYFSHIVLLCRRIARQCSDLEGDMDAKLREETGEQPDSSDEDMWKQMIHALNSRVCDDILCPAIKLVASRITHHPCRQDFIDMMCTILQKGNHLKTLHVIVDQCSIWLCGKRTRDDSGLIDGPVIYRDGNRHVPVSGQGAHELIETEKLQLLRSLHGLEPNAADSLTTKFSEIVLHLFSQPHVPLWVERHASQYLTDGLLCSNVVLRKKFCQLITAKCRPTLFDRLQFIFEFDWQPLSHRFWISCALEFLFEALVGETGKGQDDGFVERAVPSPLGLESMYGISEDVLRNQIRKAAAALDAEQSVPKSVKNDLTSFFASVIGFGNIVKDCETITFLHSLRELAYGEVQTAYALWVSLFPAAWSSISSEERRILVPKMATFLALDHNRTPSLRPNGTAHRHNFVQAILEAIAACDPRPFIPAHVLAFAAECGNAYQMVLPLLEQQLFKSEASERVDHVDALVILYEALDEQALFRGVHRMVSDHPITSAALSLEAIGMFEAAQQTYTHLMREVTAENKISVSTTEMSMWESRWVECSRQLCQWENLSQYSRLKENGKLLVECAWRLQDWKTVKDTLVVPEFSSLAEGNDPLIKILQISYGIHTAQIDKVSSLLKQAMKLAVHQWKFLPMIPCHSQRPLLCIFQQLMELEESAGIMKVISESSREKKTPDFKNLVVTWRQRLPASSDSPYVWDCIMSWRNKMHTTIADLFREKDDVACLHDTPWTVVMLAKMARKKGLLGTSMRALEMLSNFDTMDVTDAYNKLREQILVCKHPDQANSGLGFINQTKLSYFKKDQKSEMFRLKARFTQLLGQNNEANPIFGQSLQIWRESAKAWHSWAKHLASSITPPSPGMRTELPTTVLNNVCQTIVAFLQSVYHGSESKLLGIVHVLYYLGTMQGTDQQIDQMGQIFQQHSQQLPVWKWLMWIPQLLSSLSRPEGPYLKPILFSIAKQFPQALYYILRAKYLERKEMIHNALTNPNDPKAAHLCIENDANIFFDYVFFEEPSHKAVEVSASSMQSFSTAQPFASLLSANVPFPNATNANSSGSVQMPSMDSLDELVNFLSVNHCPLILELEFVTEHLFHLNSRQWFHELYYIFHKFLQKVFTIHALTLQRLLLNLTTAVHSTSADNKSTVERAQDVLDRLSTFETDFHHPIHEGFFQQLMKIFDRLLYCHLQAFAQYQAHVAKTQGITQKKAQRHSGDAYLAAKGPDDFAPLAKLSLQYLLMFISDFMRQKDGQSPDMVRLENQIEGTAADRRSILGSLRATLTVNSTLTEHDLLHKLLGWKKLLHHHSMRWAPTHDEPKYAARLIQRSTYLAQMVDVDMVVPGQFLGDCDPSGHITHYVHRFAERIDKVDVDGMVCTRLALISKNGNHHNFILQPSFSYLTWSNLRVKQFHLLLNRLLARDSLAEAANLAFNPAVFEPLAHNLCLVKSERSVMSLSKVFQSEYNSKQECFRDRSKAESVIRQNPDDFVLKHLHYFEQQVRNRIYARLDTQDLILELANKNTDLVSPALEFSYNIMAKEEVPNTLLSCFASKLVNSSCDLHMLRKEFSNNFGLFILLNTTLFFDQQFNTLDSFFMNFSTGRMELFSTFLHVNYGTAQAVLQQMRSEGNNVKDHSGWNLIMSRLCKLTPNIVNFISPINLQSHVEDTLAIASRTFHKQHHTLQVLLLFICIFLFFLGLSFYVFARRHVFEVPLHNRFQTTFT
eukprot:TRINITY_DN241_c0_g1_i4.p1 TRINITY_DN241_c0_g1~~TRINITY_DN241_c0_g1_i4.p1  ORF type:complete len:4473 (-),score=800.75 TRINITY_DN241_c0_g1_i4:399-13817(-)